MFEAANELLCYLLLANEQLALDVLKNGFSGHAAVFNSFVANLHPEALTKFSHTLLTVYQNGSDSGGDDDDGGGSGGGGGGLPPPDCSTSGDACVKCKNNEACCAAGPFVERMVALVASPQPPWMVCTTDRVLNLESMKMDTVVSTWDEVGGQRERENTIEIEIEIH
jgi:hypothetical protein